MTTAVKADWVPRDTLGARVVVIRHSLGLSRRQLSQLTGITENALQGLEEGRSPHRLPDKIQAIHEATGVSREWLMWGGPLSGEGPRQDGPGGGESAPSRARTDDLRIKSPTIVALARWRPPRENDHADRTVAA